jgi:hypothetical protein
MGINSQRLVAHPVWHVSICAVGKYDAISEIIASSQAKVMSVLDQAQSRADTAERLGEAEFHRHAAAGLGFGNAGGGEVGNATIDMVLEFAGESTLERPRRNQLKSRIIGYPPRRSG